MIANNTLIIIQARMTSTRLPKKVLLPLCGSTVLGTMIKRLHPFHDNIVIATTDDGTQQPIVEFCKEVGLKYYEGSTEDVLERYCKAADAHGADDGTTIVRCTSDCPLIDHEIIANALAYHHANGFDYTAATTKSGFARGMDTEIFSYGLLKEALANARTYYEHEHVTPYMHTTYNHALKIGRYRNSRDDSHLRITLDEPHDYDAIKAIFEAFECRFDMHYDEIIALLQQRPDIVAMNAHVEQKKR